MEDKEEADKNTKRYLNDPLAISVVPLKQSLDLQFSVNVVERKTATKMDFLEAVEFEEKIKQEIVENSNDDSQVLEKKSQIVLPKLSEENTVLKNQVKSLTLRMEKLEEENKVTVFESSSESRTFQGCLLKGFVFLL